MHYKEITELAIEKNLLSHVGKSPEVTMGARLGALLKKDDKSNAIVRVKPGVFGLREWNDKKGRRGNAERAATEAASDEAADDDSNDVNALEVEAATRESAPPSATERRSAYSLDDSDDDEAPVVSGDEALRADLAASAADLFDDEDDDDQPILGGGSAPNGAAAGDAGADPARRRRRRRRRGGRSGQENGVSNGVPADRGSSLRLGPNGGSTHSDSDTGNGGGDFARDPMAPAPRPMVRERQQIMAGGTPTGIEVPLAEGDELAGRELADAAALVMSSFDRNAGPVPLRAIADSLMRRGRLAGDAAMASIQLSASVRADNLRRAAQGQRARFRFATGGRISLTDWALGGDLLRLEQEALSAIDRYREAARRTMLRRLQELPGHAFTELALLGLERVGMTQLKAVRRLGAAGGEAHYSAVHKTGSDEIRTAIILRRDGREIGRERVTDIRGALQHYNGATAGWLITTGQVLSGAREEAAMTGAPPVALFDGLSFCRLLDEHDVATVRTRLSIAIPDLELFESLRG